MLCRLRLGNWYGGWQCHRCTRSTIRAVLLMTFTFRTFFLISFKCYRLRFSFGLGKKVDKSIGNIRSMIGSQDAFLNPWRVILVLSVCLNIYISQNISARVTKFAGNNLSYCAHRMFVFKFDHASFCCRKLIALVALVLFCRLLKESCKPWWI